jgi:putative transposase
LCLQAGTAAIEAMLAADPEQLCGKRYQRHAGRQGDRWGMIDCDVGWHGGKAAIRRPRERQRGGAELELPSWTAIQKAELLSGGAFNQMLIGCGDAQVPAVGTTAGRRSGRSNLAAVCGTEHGKAEGMAGS